MKLLNASDTDDAIIYQNIKTNERSLSLHRIYKMQLLISLWKKYYLIVFLDHGALRSEKKEILSLSVC